MPSLDQYWTYAERMIAINTRSPVKELMLSDSEAVGLVARAIMKADESYRGDRGTKLDSWRFNLAEKEIRSRKRWFKKKMKFESLDAVREFESSHRTPDEIVENEEKNRENKSRVKKLLSLTNPTERACLEMSFLLGYTDDEIAHELGITREGVRKSKISGIKLMKELSNGC